MIGRLLWLHTGELRRLGPFFALYLLLFTALTIADGLSLALFVQKVGATALPTYYGITALTILILMGGYLRVAAGMAADRVFAIILAGSASTFFLAWAALQWFHGGPFWYGLLFVGREVSFTLILMHFGTYLQLYFTREQLNRVLPLVYAGGRVGGILGGGLLERLSAVVGLLNLVLVFLALSGVCLGLLQIISRKFLPVNVPEDERGDPGLARPKGGDARALEAAARTSSLGFLRFVWTFPLMFWLTVASLWFVVCRWILNFQYNAFFEAYFPDDLAMAQFLGRYTQIALAVSLVIQVMVVNRLVAWIGLKGTHLLYGALLLVGLCLNLLPMTLGMAIFGRVLEHELRFGLRNPIAQLTMNKLPKPLRMPARAWTLGLLIPLATLAASTALKVLVDYQASHWIPWMGAAAGVGYFLSSLGLFTSFEEKPRFLTTRFRWTKSRASRAGRGGASAPDAAEVRSLRV